MGTRRRAGRIDAAYWRGDNMTIQQFRQKLIDAGFIPASTTKPIDPDTIDGVIHKVLPVYKIDGGGRALARVGYYHDVNGHLGDAGEVYPDYELSGINLRAIIEEPVDIEPKLAELAVTKAMTRPGVIGAQAQQIGECAVVSVVQIVDGTAVPKQFAVYRDGKDLAVVPYVEP